MQEKMLDLANKNQNSMTTRLAAPNPISAS
jgi:hypothetical protein